MAYNTQVDILEPVNLSEHLEKIELYLGQVCQIAGISKMQLDYWTNKAQIPTKGKKQRIYDIEALETRSSSPRRRITITPWVERPSRLTSSTGIRITVPPVEISITW